MTTETEKKTTLKFEFRANDGTLSRSPNAHTVALNIARTDTNEVITSVGLAEFQASGLMHTAAWHGLKQSLNDASTSKGKDGTLEDRIELLLSRRETIILDKEWLAERESAGPRTSDIAVAVGRIKGFAEAKNRAASVKALEKLAAEKGEAFDKSKLVATSDPTEFAGLSIAAYRALVGEEAGKTYLANLRKAPQVAAIVAELEQERKAARIAKLKASTETVDMGF